MSERGAKVTSLLRGLTLGPESGTFLVQEPTAKFYTLLEEILNIHFAVKLGRKNRLVLI